MLVQARDDSHFEEEETASRKYHDWIEAEYLDD